ncbi:MAG: pirin family protein [Bdellovibrionaceae bacterium]|nr:pirin family protein [Pseudobdellovibrionaceae bacterium]
MSQENIIISGRKRDLGGFMVARTIPSAERRHVGPFVFLDHMGPLKITETAMLDVRPHPHIGLSTVTYLFSGRGHHRDSLGYSQVISPGDINWMTAGRGIVHSERTPDEDKFPNPSAPIHGIQVWVALPVEHEDTDPNFTHYPKSQIPDIEFTEGLNGKLMIGTYQEEGYTLTSPVKTYSPTFFAEMKSTQDLNHKLSLAEEEIGIFLVEGQATINDHKLEMDDLIIVSDPKNISLELGKGTTLILIGGTAFKEPRYIWWNLVSSSKEKIQQAAKRWEKQEMGKVEGEIDYIPLPDIPFPA